MPFDEIRGNDLRVLWAIHSGQRPPPILDCPEILESLMNRCWNKDASVRPTMGEIVQTMSFIQVNFLIILNLFGFFDLIVSSGIRVHVDMLYTTREIISLPEITLFSVLICT